MTETEFLSLLNTIDFSQRYWRLCDRFPVQPSGRTGLGRKEDIMGAFAEVGIKPRYRDRTFEFEVELIGGLRWAGLFVKQYNGVELEIYGEVKNLLIGSNFAVLAYDAKRLADPTFTRDPFKGPPPYPRPHHDGDPTTLREIVKEHVLLVRAIKDALRHAAARPRE